MRVRRAALVASIVLSSAILGLAFGESLLRVAGYSFKLYPETVQFGWPDPEVLKEQYQVDQDLLWVPTDYQDRLRAARVAPLDIAFLGDSCTQFGSYPERVKTALERRFPDGNFHIANLGVGGWSSYQGLQQLRRDVIPLKPRLALFYFGWNDHWNTFGIEDRRIGRFHRYNSPDLTLRRLRVMQLLDAARLSFETRHSDGPQPRVSLPDFRANLEAMVRLARDHGITPVLLTAPANHVQGREPDFLTRRWLDDLSDLVPRHRRYVEQVRAVARQEDVLLVDLERDFAGLRPEELRFVFQSDGIHLTPVGDGFAAGRILQILAGADQLDGLRD